jgi:uncharacterized protein (TIGR00730 family)
MPFLAETGGSTDSATTSPERRAGPPSRPVASRLSWRLPGAIGASGSSTHSPRASAVTSPSGLSPSSTRTRSPGTARPAITAWPLGSMRTMSKLGAFAADGFAAADAGGVGTVCEGAVTTGCGAGRLGGAVPRSPMIAAKTSSNAAIADPSQTMLRTILAAPEPPSPATLWRPGRACNRRRIGRRRVRDLSRLRGSMQPIRRLCVYCGSAVGNDHRYREAARELGDALAKAGIELVYGGGRIGLMGVLADAVLAGRGRVVGIIPGALRDAELAHHGASELVIAGGMHERKRLMAERADAFAVLPGGIGTLDETFEILSWKQLRLHAKPIFLVDVGGYWAPLRALLDHVVASGFAAPPTRELLQIVPNVAALMTRLAQLPPAPATIAAHRL